MRGAASTTELASLGSSSDEGVDRDGAVLGPGNEVPVVRRPGELRNPRGEVLQAERFLPAARMPQGDQAIEPSRGKQRPRALEGQGAETVRVGLQLDGMGIGGALAGAVPD